MQYGLPVRPIHWQHEDQHVQQLHFRLCRMRRNVEQLHCCSGLQCWNLLLLSYKLMRNHMSCQLLPLSHYRFSPLCQMWCWMLLVFRCRLKQVHQMLTNSKRNKILQKAKHKRMHPELSRGVLWIRFNPHLREVWSLMHHLQHRSIGLPDMQKRVGNRLFSPQQLMSPTLSQTLLRWPNHQWVLKLRLKM